MNRFAIFTLKAIRRSYSKLTNQKVKLPDSDQNPDSVSNTIQEYLLSDKPCMIARFGSTELTCLANYISIKKHQFDFINYLKGNTQPWWWENKIIKQMQEWSGFFPANISHIEKFCELMIQDVSQVDVLGSWQQNEFQVDKELGNAKKIRLMYLDPFWSKAPWTKVLENKKVLVVHPFAKTIHNQYQKRDLLFDNKEILPQFKSLSVIQAIQSLGKGDERFEDWFDALNYMKNEIDKHDYEICLIGCGAYGFPLAAHVKRMGKKAVHMGGSLQLLFGIRGKRWEVYDPHYEQPGNVFIHYYGLPNDYWVRPSDNEKPENHKKVEDSCYW